MTGFSITIEQDAHDHWYWSVCNPQGSYGAAIFVRGFFREYGYGEERSRERAERKARSFLKRYEEQWNHQQADQISRDKTREIIVF